MSDEARCDHEKRIHLRPVVLCSERIPTTTSSLSIYVTMRCYACGQKWTETQG